MNGAAWRPDVSESFISRDDARAAAQGERTRNNEGGRPERHHQRERKDNRQNKES